MKKRLVIFIVFLILVLLGFYFYDDISSNYGKLSGAAVLGGGNLVTGGTVGVPGEGGSKEEPTEVEEKKGNLLTGEAVSEGEAGAKFHVGVKVVEKKE